MNLRNCIRDSFLRNFTSPVIEAPCTWKTFFARSIPIIVSVVIFAVLPIPFGQTDNSPTEVVGWVGRQPLHLFRTGH